MAIYAVTNRQFETKITYCAKEALAFASLFANQVNAPVKPVRQKVAKVQITDVQFNRTSNEVVVDGCVVGVVTGFRDSQNREDRHIPYTIEIAGTSYTVGSFAYKKEIVDAIQGGELKKQLQKALTDKATDEAFEEAKKQPVWMLQPLDVRTFRAAAAGKTEVYLNHNQEEDWTVKVTILPH